jgi:hypothetical protein
MGGLLPESCAFSSAEPQALLPTLPVGPMAGFAMNGDVGTQPYVGVAADLRRRLARLLVADPAHPRRLQLAARVRWVAWRAVGSALEAQATQFQVLVEMYGERALERMHLRMPAFVRFHGGNRYPRLSVTTRIRRDEGAWFYGPFPSRAAAERYGEEVLKLFLLRRCEENLAPDPSHPGCVYSEMKKCLAPCFGGCTDARYGEEAAAVQRFLATRGESRLRVLSAARDEASAQLEFEQAAALHAQAKQVEWVSGLAAEVVRPLERLRACIALPAAEPDAVALYLFAEGALHGPEMFSTLGMRIQNEGSGSSSLYAQPMLVEPVPLRETAPVSEPAPVGETLSERLEATLQRLEARSRMATEALRQQGDLALLTRWYYRPAQKRVGEIFFPDAKREWPRKAMLRGVGRVAAARLAVREKDGAGVG